MRTSERIAKGSKVRGPWRDQIDESQDMLMSFHRAEPLVRVGMIKAGVSATVVKQLLHRFTIGQSVMLQALNIPVATINRKAQKDDRLAPAESERVLGMADLIAQVEQMVQESGNPEGFDAATWLSRWLSEALPALGGRRPIDLLSTIEGQRLVADMLRRMQTGAYA